MTSNMTSMFKTLNSIQTNLLTWANPFECNGSDVIVCITGNPGLPDFYIEFGAQLHKHTGFPICVIGQAGHREVPEIQSNVLKNQEHLFNLKGQIAHKLDLINNHIDKKSRLHLVGHSIGAWLIIEILQKHNNIYDRVSSINLLFPTLQRLAKTQQGEFLNRFIRKVHVILILLCCFLNILPQSVILFLIQLYLKCNSLPLNYTERILKFLSPKVVEKVLFLAYNEMDEVKELNLLGMEKIKRMCNVIYGTRDNWVPIEYIEDLKRFKPQLQLKEADIDHAFVLKSSERVANMVCDFIYAKMGFKNNVNTEYSDSF